METKISEIREFSESSPACTTANYYYKIIGGQDEIEDNSNLHIINICIFHKYLNYKLNTLKLNITWHILFITLHYTTQTTKAHLTIQQTEK
jgi:hypothetical protein